MNSSPLPQLRGASNNTNIGAGAQIEQIALGNNITRVKGYTAEQVTVLISALRASDQPTREKQ